MALRLDRGREIYEPVFIGRVVSFIDVAEVGMECWRQFLGLLPFALNLIADPLRESWGRAAVEASAGVRIRWAVANYISANKRQPEAR